MHVNVRDTATKLQTLSKNQPVLKTNIKALGSYN